MKLSREVKDLIKKEYDEFKDQMYAGKTKEERDDLAQFFTPPEISFRLIEELTDLSGNILDPTSGSGNLLAAALIAGADSDKIFGNDYDYTMVILCRDRLNKVCDMLGKPHIKDWQVHRGNALHEFALTYFNEDYDDMYRATDYKIINNKRVYNIDNENYDAYTDSKTFAKKYPELAHKKSIEALNKQAEDQGYVGLFGEDY